MKTYKSVIFFPMLTLLLVLISSCINFVTFTKGIPAAPSSLALTSPESSPNFDETPIITVSGVQIGDTIKLFTDSSCTAQTGSPAIASATTIVIATSALPAATYNFYANSTGAGGTSSCSTATVNYILISCPNGYIMVPGNATVGAPDNFCVMQYEAQNSGGNPASESSGVPWTSISQVNAKVECTSLGASFDLISNPEWIAIARNIENVAANWTSNIVGQGCLKRGNIDGLNGCVGGDSSYDGGSPDNVGSRTNYNGTAELILDNGNTIFDFSGNVWEWVDWTLGGDLETDMTQANRASIDGTPEAVYLELSALNYFTAHSPVTALLPSDSTFNADQGMGRYIAGTSGGAAIRGGCWYSSTHAGVFALALDDLSSAAGTNGGFRCVFRLP